MRVLQELPHDEVENKENYDPTLRPSISTPMPRIMAGLKRLVGAEAVAVHASVHKQQSSAESEPSAYSKYTATNSSFSPDTSVNSQDSDPKYELPLQQARGPQGARDKIGIPPFTLMTRVNQLDSRVSTKPQDVSYQLSMSTCITVPEYPQVQAYMAIFIDTSSRMSPSEFRRALDVAAHVYRSGSGLYPRLYTFSDHPLHVRFDHLRDVVQSTSSHRDIAESVCAIYGEALEQKEESDTCTLPQHVIVISSASLCLDELFNRVKRLHIHTLCVSAGFIARRPILDSPGTCGWVLNTCPQSLSLIPVMFQCMAVGLVIEPLRNLRVTFESNGWEPIEDEQITSFYPGMYLERAVQYVLDRLPEEQIAQAPYGHQQGAVESLEAALGIYFIKTGLLTVSYEMSGIEGLVRREHPLHTKRFEFDDDVASPAVSQEDATAIWRNLDVGCDPAKR